MSKIRFYTKELFCRFIDDEVLYLAGDLAYSLLLSFFPFLIFILTILGYSSIDSEQVLAALKNVLPYSAYDLIHNTVREILESQKGNLLSFGIVGTLWAGASGFRAVIRGLNKAYDEEEKRNVWQILFISILCVIGVTLIIFGAVTLLIFGSIIGFKLTMRFNLTSYFFFGWNIFRYIFMVLVMILIFTILYEYTPSRRLNFMEVLPGAVLTTIGWILSSIGFAYYVNNFGSYSRVYGSIGAVIMVMVWLYIGSIMILLGGELNAARTFYREGKNKPTCKKF